MTGPVLHRTSVETGRGESILQAPLAIPQRPARVVIAGECNSGKTWLANALLGAPVLPTSFVTRTVLPTVVESGPRPRLVLEKHDRSRVATSWEQIEAGACEGRRLCVRLPSAKLKGLRLIDTPGLGDGDEAVSRRVRGYCRTADVVVWCTPALQAWKGSELGFWLSLPASVRDKGVLVLTFADMLRHDQDVKRVLGRLQAEAALYFRRMVTAAQLPDLLAQATPDPAACTIQQPAIESRALLPALLGA
jgi:predicted GTPase